jgi:hypothetical protein
VAKRKKGDHAIIFGEKTGWFSTLRWRYISSRPLTEDGVFQSPPLITINGRVGYQFANGWRIQLGQFRRSVSVEYDFSVPPVGIFLAGT